MECEKREFQLQAVCFAAGTAVFIACLERAVVLSFMEQWRVLMFLALNLLLLAILFTSTHPILSDEGVKKDSNSSEEKLKAAESMKQEEPCHHPVMVFVADKENKDDERAIAEADFKKEEIAQSDLKVQENGEAEVKEQAFNQLSKEELNQRVEAFIAMFRQHLISDNAKGRSCRQLHSSFSEYQRDYVLPKQFR